MGQTVSLSSATGAIGSFELDSSPGFCGGGSFGGSEADGPRGLEWEAAEPGFQRFLNEAKDVARSVGGCCGYNLQSVKAALDTQWITQANSFLSSFNLRADTFLWVSDNGKHLRFAIQIFKAHSTEYNAGLPKTAIMFV